MKKIIILGSTGSIGTQALEIIEANPDINPELVKGLRKDIIDAGVSNIGISMQ